MSGTNSNTKNSWISPQERSTNSAFSLETSHVFVTGRGGGDGGVDQMIAMTAFAAVAASLSLECVVLLPGARRHAFGQWQPGHVLRVADEEEAFISPTTSGLAAGFTLHLQDNKVPLCILATHMSDEDGDAFRS
jgi:hypothetical protein